MLEKSVLFNISNVAIGALKGGQPWLDQGPRSKERSVKSTVCELKLGRPTRWLPNCPEVISKKLSLANG